MAKTQKMNFYTCLVALAGDITNVASRSTSRPVSAAEVAVLQAIHDPAAVTDLQPCEQVETDAREEKGRLIGIYGAEPVEKLYPGAVPFMDFDLGLGTPQKPKRQTSRAKSKAQEAPSEQSGEVSEGPTDEPDTPEDADKAD